MNALKLSTTLSLLLLTGVGYAQSATGNENTGSDNTQVFTLEDMVITGEKLGRTLQETQTSVALHSAATLQQMPTTDISDVFNLTANTYAYDGGFSIRGITNTGLTNSEGSEMATVLVDGARVDAEMLTFDGLTMWDVEQIEILRGPQSTSMGRNALAGAVVVTTKQPTFDWDAALKTTYGEDDTYQLAAAAGGPIVDEMLAFRLSVDHQYSDGALENVTRDEDDWARQDTLSFRGKLLFQPEAWNGFSATLTYMQTDSDNGERAYAYSDVRDELFDRIAVENTRNNFDSRSRLASLVIDQDLVDGWKLTATTAWSDFHSDSAYDGDRTAEEDIVYGYGYDNDSVSQEIRLLGRGESWRLLAGVYGAYESTETHSSGPFYYVIPPSYLPVFGLPDGARALIDNQSNYDIDTDNFAAFINGDWDVMPELTLTFGLRFDYEQKDRFSEQNVVLLQGYPDHFALIDVPSMGIPAGTPADVALAAIADQASSRGEGTDDYSKLLPSVGVTYHWTDKMSTGFTVSTGYRSGGVSFNQARGQTVTFDPESTINYELSYRSQWLEDRLTFNANLFYVDWKDQQVSLQRSDDLYDSNVVNASESHYYGFEVELREWLNDGLSFYQSIGYTKTQFDDYQNPYGNEDYTHNAFPQSPEWTASVGAHYQHSTGIFANGSLSYVDEAWANIDNVDPYYLDDRLLLDAKIGYQADHWSVYLYGTNLLDDEYLERMWAEAGNGYGAVVGKPRIVGIGFEADY